MSPLRSISLIVMRQRRLGRDEDPARPRNRCPPAGASGSWRQPGESFSLSPSRRRPSPPTGGRRPRCRSARSPSRSSFVSTKLVQWMSSGPMPRKPRASAQPRTLQVLEPVPVSTEAASSRTVQSGLSVMRDLDLAAALLLPLRVPGRVEREPDAAPLHAVDDRPLARAHAASPSSRSARTPSWRTASRLLLGQRLPLVAEVLDAEVDGVHAQLLGQQRRRGAPRIRLNWELPTPRIMQAGMTCSCTRRTTRGGCSGCARAPPPPAPSARTSARTSSGRRRLRRSRST